MKIFLIHYGISNEDGSSQSIQTLADSLKNVGHQVWYSRKKCQLKEWDPDIIIAQQWAIEWASQKAWELNILMVVLVRGLGQYEHFFNPNSTNRRCDLLVSNTCNLLSQIKHLDLYQPQTCVLHPQITLEKCLFLEPHIPEYITLIGSEPCKGFDMLGPIANSLPMIKFLWVTNQSLDMPPNVKTIKKQPDVRTIYQKTAILIMPSISESYGRVAIEAAHNRIPVIASNLEGIREATNGLAYFVENRTDVGLWKRAILDVLMNYDEHQNRMKRVIDGLDNGEFERFNQMLEKLMRQVSE